MKKIFILILLPQLIFCQIKKGYVKYGVNVPFDEKTAGFFNQERINRVNTFEFELKFNNNQSVFEMVDNKLAGNLNSKYNAGLCMSSGIYYKENINSLLLRATDNEEFGKLIVQIDNNVKWLLVNESKIIDGYTCYKAISEIYFYDQNLEFPVKLIAWYCPKIPLSFGPKCFSGLPGLILELVNGNITFTATKIVLNPLDEVVVSKPTDGKLITNLEFKKLAEDLIAEYYKKP
jgi:GLPGLI family protein